ncbi:Arabinan endo-1,5-alpha-L-arabinosidase C [Aspergillus falconensis]
MKVAITYILHQLLSIFSITSYPAPNTCSGDCWAHDPGLYQRVSDGKYFRFATGSGIHIHSADTLYGPWKAIGEALPNGTVINHPGRSRLWAPDIHYDQSTKTYHMYYTVSTLGSRDSVIGFASSPDLTPESWEDHGAVFRSTKKDRYNAIDGNWVEIERKPYLNFGSYWDGLFQMPLSLTRDGNLKEEEKRHATHNPRDALNHLAYNATGHHRIEAPFIFRHGSWYYLLFSSGRATKYEKTLPAQGEEYKIMVCRSKSGRGDFVDKSGKSCLESGGTILLASHGNIYGPGGQGVFKDDQHGLVLFYHYADKNIGLSSDQYQFGWNILRWEDDWPAL